MTSAWIFRESIDSDQARSGMGCIYSSDELKPILDAWRRFARVLRSLPDGTDADARLTAWIAALRAALAFVWRSMQTSVA